MARIVLVEESDALRESLRRSLETEGHEVDAYADAERALAAIEAAPPELLVTDVALPGMSGITLIETLRQTFDRLHLPVVVVSSLEATEEVTRGYAAGADDYLLKPVRTVELAARVRALIERRAHAQAATRPASSEPEWKRYDRKQLLGRGESVTIHRAQRRGDGLEVVLKAVTPAASDAEVRRLLAEAELLRSLGEQPNLSRVRDVGEDGGCAYYAMQWVPGVTLNVPLEQGPYVPGRAATIARGLAQALAALAENDVVHGDVKPSNVVVTRSDGVVLIDFGIAHRAGPPAAHSGTLAYVAPEVLRGEPSQPSGDVYAFGVLLYELLCGELPFSAYGGDLAALKIEGVSPSLEGLLQRDLPPGLIAAVEACFEPDPTRRASAAELADALLPYQALTSSA